MIFLFQLFKSLVKVIGQKINQTFKSWTRPASRSQILGTLSDFNRSKTELLAETALLRQQLIVLNRQNKPKRPQFKPLDRFFYYAPC